MPRKKGKRPSYHMRRVWARAYSTRMRRGWEHCRNPGCSNLAATFGHLVPYSAGGMYNAGNLTLLCEPCNQKQGTDYWDWLIPLNQEPDFMEICGLVDRCDMGPTKLWHSHYQSQSPATQRRQQRAIEHERQLKTACQVDTGDRAVGPGGETTSAVSVA